MKKTKCILISIFCFWALNVYCQSGTKVKERMLYVTNGYNEFYGVRIINGNRINSGTLFMAPPGELRKALNFGVYSKLGLTASYDKIYNSDLQYFYNEDAFLAQLNALENTLFKQTVIGKIFRIGNEINNRQEMLELIDSVNYYNNALNNLQYAELIKSIKSEVDDDNIKNEKTITCIVKGLDCANAIMLNPNLFSHLITLQNMFRRLFEQPHIEVAVSNFIEKKKSSNLHLNIAYNFVSSYTFNNYSKNEKRKYARTDLNSIPLQIGIKSKVPIKNDDGYVYFDLYTNQTEIFSLQSNDTLDYNRKGVQFRNIGLGIGYGGQKDENVKQGLLNYFVLFQLGYKLTFKSTYLINKESNKLLKRKDLNQLHSHGVYFRCESGRAIGPTAIFVYFNAGLNPSEIDKADDYRIKGSVEMGGGIAVPIKRMNNYYYK